MMGSQLDTGDAVIIVDAQNDCCPDGTRAVGKSAGVAGREAGARLPAAA